MQISSRFVYLIILASMLIPLIGQVSMSPARSVSAERTYSVIESLSKDSAAPEEKKYALVFIDYGPGTQAENAPQAEVIIEHLFRMHIPVVVITTYALSEQLSVTAPEKVAARLQKESAALSYEYGKDWIVLGFRPGRDLFLQGLSQSKELATFLGDDVKGRKVAEYADFAQLHSLKNVDFVAEFTGLVGFLSSYIQYLIRKDIPITLIHGCTSISIPETYIYTDSGQLAGTLEGISGAAAYAALLSKRFPARAVDDAIRINSALGFSQLAILLLILFGNVQDIFKKKKQGEVQV